jgi:hypothetical protein
LYLPSNRQFVTPVSLTLKAGAGALKFVKSHGFDISSIGTIAGASGGAKWLVLSQLDRAILSNVVPKLQGPVHLLGSSIGAWRFACYAQSDPIAAINRFEDAYLDQKYSDTPDTREITHRTREILRHVLGDNGASEILSHPVFRTHIMAVRSRHLLASESRYVLGAGLIAAAALNLISRRSLGLFFERALFHDSRERPPFYDVDDFPIQKITLSEENLADSIIATGAIPLALYGVRDIAGASSGMYRDGGIIDYHHDLPHSVDGRLTLYPHFYDRITPGWFDKGLSWRVPNPVNVDRTILISPSAEFVSRLPNSKIPDRSDFTKFSPAERVDIWRKCVVACEQMADEFCEILEKNQLAACLQPL